MPRLQDITGNVKKYGERTFLKGSDPFTPRDFPRIPTGIISLDYMIGGGFPVGVTSSIYGPPGGGKTLVMTRLATGAQNICWNCYKYLWDCDCESRRSQKVVIVQCETFDLDWAEQLGLDLDDVIIAEPDSGEEASDIIHDCLRADDCGLVLLDSLPMLVPTVELETSAQEVQVASQAKLISKLIRRIKADLIREKKRGHPVAFVTTNQVRAKIGGFSRGPSEEIPGGFTSKHDWHLTIRMSQLKSDDIDKSTELPIISRFKASSAAMGNKRKVFMLSGSCEFFIATSDAGANPKGSIVDQKTAMTLADQCGILQRDPWRFNGVEFPTKAAIAENWFDDNKYLSDKKVIVDACIADAKARINSEG